MRSRQAAEHQTGLPSFRRSLSGQAVCPAVVGGLLSPPGNQRKLGQRHARYDEEPDHRSRQRHRPRQIARTVSTTEAGLTILAHQRASRRGNWEGVFSLHIAPWGEPAVSPRRDSRTEPGARGKTKELMVNDRAAIPGRASLRRSARSSPEEGGDLATAGRRQSQHPSTGKRISPKGDQPSGRSSPGSTSEEVKPRAIRTLYSRSRTALPASQRPEVLRPP